MPNEEGTQLPEWGPGKTVRGRARLPSSRRRERPVLSCNLCRRRKLRCDRQHPCGACTQRELGSSCTYPPSEPATAAGPRRPPPAVQDRIQQLENLVVDLMQKTSSRHGPSGPSASPGLPTPLETTAPSTSATPEERAIDSASSTSNHVSMQGTSYVNNSHWAAILDGIAEIRDLYDEDDEAPPIPPAPDAPFPGWAGPQLLYGCSRLATKQEILASIPERPVVDRLISSYFNSFEISSAVLHSGQFLKEYDEFWEDPPEAPVIWLGLLFTILGLATLFQKFRLDPDPQTPAAASMERDLQAALEMYRQNTVQCLILANYPKGGPYVLETLILHVASEKFYHRDTEISVWLLVGTVVQLAMRMGYHRDPRHLGGTSPFRAEMRRRVWATVIGLDLAVSTQMGLPRLIKQCQADTEDPSNYQDSDFDEATAEMPPPRPDTDLTPMLYSIVKSKVTAALGYIADFAADTRPYTHDEVMHMEGRLQEAHAAIPPCLRWRSMAHCVADSPQVIMQKVFLEIMVHRARIVLHRRYMHGPPAQHADLRKACVDAALALLEFQHILQEETQPFCQLYQERWRVSSLVNNDFLLATSILCFYLKRSRAGTNQGSEVSEFETIRAALKRSYDIWRLSSSSSVEARKATKALGVILSSGTSSDKSPGVEATTPLDQFSVFSDNNAIGCYQDSPAGFGVKFPVFDESVLSAWPSAISPNPGGFPATAAASDDGGWQLVGAMDTMASQNWPWNLH